MRVTTSRRSCESRRSYSLCSMILILLSTSSLGCPKPPPPPPDPIPSPIVCQRWNREQLIGYYALTQLAIQERARGDEAHVAAAVEELGALLTRCGILTRSKARPPGPADDPDPISSEKRGRPPGVTE